MASGQLSWNEEQLAWIAADHDLLSSYQVLKYANVGLLTILLYDHAITFNMETLNLLQGSKDMVAELEAAQDIIYDHSIFSPRISMRDCPISGIMKVPPVIECTAKLFTAFPTVVAVTSVELMLILRVLALYSNGKRMARFLITAFFIQLGIWSGIAILILVNTRPIHGERVFTGCLFVVPKYAVIGWVPGLLFEILLIVLTIHKARKYGRFSSTLKVLTRDSVLYFGIISGVFLFNIIYYVVGRHILAPSLILPSNVVTCIAAARLTMNIRRFTMDEGMQTLAQNGLGTIAHPGPPRPDNAVKPVPFRPREHIPTDEELAHEENELRIMNQQQHTQ
ncbi:hypothetical protein CVT24_004650 [Panaeolus cyanescens]|uniref:G-protein coupled receptors family 1 profile domain-containing protein n=1 Tax=Panaeolus cyanescens TaxID=181874 RepID=A0A409W7R1_9AGAR|nr:hypothetical protein CVT24_004650 [Panaeolus cyanescens]